MIDRDIKSAYIEYMHKVDDPLTASGLDLEVLRVYIQCIMSLTETMKLEKESQAIQLMEDLAMIKPELCLRPLAYLAACGLGLVKLPVEEE